MYKGGLVAKNEILYFSKIAQDDIQFQKMNMDHILNKPCVNEVTLTEQYLN